jgi:hypothetical protein
VTHGFPIEASVKDGFFRLGAGFRSDDLNDSRTWSMAKDIRMLAA